MTSPSYGQSVPNDVVAPISAELAFYTRYRSQKNHKAIAFGQASLWYMSYGQASQKAAANHALQSCQKSQRKSAHRATRGRPCYLFAVGNKIVSLGNNAGPPLGNRIGGKDLPLLSAYQRLVRKGKVKGVVFIVHGCNRFRNKSRWAQGWFTYFNRKGYHVIVPDNFADKRPPQMCGQIPNNRVHQNFRLMRIRAAQTHRTLANLKKRYRGLPIIVWGHSEGNSVAQIAAIKPAGIITTGGLCGYGTTGQNLVYQNVPMLVLMGQKDPFIPVRTQNALTRVNTFCKAVLKPKRWRHVILRGENHFPAITSQHVRRQVDRFFATYFK
ncbi:MAG: alpha/beta hydrolase [Hyphomicrobiales bacterium]